MKIERIQYLDLAKCIAIILVCIGHSYNFLHDFSSSVKPVIYSFHMSLFMMMCGFFVGSSLKMPWKSFLIKKSKQLVIPAISASLLLSLVVLLTGRGSVPAEIYGGVWFLKALFLCFVIVYISKRLFHNDYLACVVSSSVMLLIPYGGSLMVNYYLLFFWAGHFLKKYYQTYDAHSSVITIVAFATFAIMILTGQAHAVEKVTLSTLMDTPILFLSELVCGLSGSLLVLGVCKFLSQKLHELSLINFLSSTGKYTLGIYVVQTFILEQLSESKWVALSVNTPPIIIDTIIIPVIGILFTLLSFYIVRYLSKFRPINDYLFGGQY